jgi:hypothetical protein
MKPAVSGGGEADEGVGRGPGGPPHDQCRMTGLATAAQEIFLPHIGCNSTTRSALDAATPAYTLTDSEIRSSVFRAAHRVIESFS